MNFCHFVGARVRAGLQKYSWKLRNKFMGKFSCSMITSLYYVFHKSFISETMPIEVWTSGSQLIILNGGYHTITDNNVLLLYFNQLGGSYVLISFGIKELLNLPSFCFEQKWKYNHWQHVNIHTSDWKTLW